MILCVCVAIWNIDLEMSPLASLSHAGAAVCEALRDRRTLKSGSAILSRVPPSLSFVRFPRLFFALYPQSFRRRHKVAFISRLPLVDAKWWA